MPRRYYLDRNKPHRTIKQIRIHAKKSVYELAKELPFSNATILNYEKDRVAIPVNYLCHLCAYLDTEIIIL